MKLLLRLAGIFLGLLCQLSLASAAMLMVCYQDQSTQKDAWSRFLTSIQGAKPAATTAAPTQSAVNPLNTLLARPLPVPLPADVSVQVLQRYGDWLKRHPEMGVPEKNLSETENGFLQWLNFEERVPSDYRQLGLSNALELAVMSQNKWNPQEGKKWAEANRDWLGAILTLGLYPDRSIHGVAAQRRWSKPEQSQFVRRSAHGMLIKARVALDNSDDTAALTCVNAVMGLAGHFDKLETPSMLEYTTGMTLRAEAREFVLTIVIPQLGRKNSLDFPKWQQVLAQPTYSPADLARCYVGEWQYTMQTRWLPVFALHRGVELPIDATLEAISQLYSQQSSHAESSADWPTWWSNNTAQTLPADTPEMATAAITALQRSVAEWNQSCLKSQILHSQHLAVLRQLQQEFAPSTTASPLVGDPLTGKPWQWDARTRTIQAPNDPLLIPFAISSFKLP